MSKHHEHAKDETTVKDVADLVKAVGNFLRRMPNVPVERGISFEGPWAIGSLVTGGDLGRTYRIAIIKPGSGALGRRAANAAIELRSQVFPFVPFALTPTELLTLVIWFATGSAAFWFVPMSASVFVAALVVVIGLGLYVALFVPQWLRRRCYRWAHILSDWDGRKLCRLATHIADWPLDKQMPRELHEEVWELAKLTDGHDDRAEVVASQIVDRLDHARPRQLALFQFAAAEHYLRRENARLEALRTIEEVADRVMAEPRTNGLWLARPLAAEDAIETIRQLALSVLASDLGSLPGGRSVAESDFRHVELRDS